MQAELARIHELLDKLQERGTRCRGLFPVNDKTQLLCLASDHRLDIFIRPEQLSGLSAKHLHEVSLQLEAFWRDPASTFAVLSQALLRHQPAAPALFKPGDSPGQNWKNLTDQQLRNSKAA